MLKFLIILILIGYVFYKLSAILFMVFFGRSKGTFGQWQSPSKKRQRAPGSNLEIDSMPGNKSRNSNKYEEGEYVDFEEVK